MLCAKCNTEKDADEFRDDDRYRKGKFPWCRRCCADYARELRAKGRIGQGSPRHVMSDVDRETRLGTCSVCGPGTKAWLGGGGSRNRWRCANRVRSQVSRARETHADRERVRKLRANGIKITLEQFEAMLESHAGRCAICRKETEKLCVDHDHETGEVRGLLCTTCNTGLGKFGDKPARLEAALRYLREDPASRLVSPVD